MILFVAPRSFNSLLTRSFGKYCLFTSQAGGLAVISQSVEWQNRAPGGVRPKPGTSPKPLRKTGRIPHACVVQALSLSLVFVVALLVTACGRSPQTSQSGSSGGEWREFQGTWTAAGSRNIRALGATGAPRSRPSTDRCCSPGPSRPAVGFRAEAIVLQRHRDGDGRPSGLDG